MQTDDFSEVWKALANPARRRILDELREGPMTTGELVGLFPDLSRFAVMQHIGVLKEGNLVISHKEGRRTLNHLNPIPIQQIHERWVSRYQRPWAETLVALKHELENNQPTGGRAPHTA